jgi:hypothetical protein
VATHHPAPTAKQFRAGRPKSACPRPSAPRTTTIRKRRRVLVTKGSAVRIRASAFSQPGEWLGSRLTAVHRRRSRLTATRPFWARAAKRQVASYTDAVASISMRSPGSASPVTPAIVHGRAGGRWPPPFPRTYPEMYGARRTICTEAVGANAPITLAGLGALMGSADETEHALGL